MQDLSLLYKLYGADKTIHLLNRAVEMTETNPSITWIEVQNRLHVGAESSYVIVDWLADNFKTRPRMSSHWIRCARMYVLNNRETSLEEMSSRLKVGNRTAFQIMLTLEKKGYIKILSDFKFERVKKGTDMAGFERQIQKFAKNIEVAVNQSYSKDFCILIMILLLNLLNMEEIRSDMCGEENGK